MSHMAKDPYSIGCGRHTIFSFFLILGLTIVCLWDTYFSVEKPYDIPDFVFVIVLYQKEKQNAKNVCVCVCVCVWEREREREREAMQAWREHKAMCHIRVLSWEKKTLVTKMINKAFAILPTFELVIFMGNFFGCEFALLIDQVCFRFSIKFLRGH